jgi:hypothetical protein
LERKLEEENVKHKQRMEEVEKELEQLRQKTESAPTTPKKD